MSWDPSTPGFVPELPDAEPSARPASPYGYEILGELGRGGMGVVYLARSVALERLCALKVILADVYASAEAVRRFRDEAKVVAGLRHPGIVGIYEIGDSGGRPYMALEYCPGGSLHVALNRRPLPSREAATLLRKIAAAVQSAHDAGVVHRDLKPANVLLADDGSPKVADFGLAKRLDRDGGTRAGVAIGSPSYMPPEQARGEKDVGPLADVYALGAILYECLTGRPPFYAATAVETLAQVVECDPVPVRTLNPDAPADLETIAHKCLEKSPARRYASAKALADDLGRWIDGRPVLARPVGTAERAAKWVRRNAVVTALLSLVVASLLGGTGVSLWYAREANRSAGEAFDESVRADARAADARRAEADAVAQKRQAQRERDRAELLAYAGRLALADRALDDGDGLGAVELLAGCQIDLRGWEFFHLYRRADAGTTIGGHSGSVTCAAFSPDGTRVATGGTDGTVRISGAASGEYVRTLRGRDLAVDAVAWSPDGSAVVSSGTDNRVLVHDAATGAVARSWDEDGRPYSLAFGPGGLLAVGTIRDIILREAAGRHVATFRLRPEAIKSVGFSADGLRLFAACGNAANVLDARTGRVLVHIDSATSNHRAAFSPAGDRIATADLLGHVRIFGSPTGELLRSAAILPTYGVTDIAFTKDAARLVCGGGDGATRVLDSTTLAVVHRHVGRSGLAEALAVSPDGRLFAAGYPDGFASVRNVLPPSPADAAPPTFPSGASFSPDGTRFVSAGPGNAATIRDSRTLLPVTTLVGHDNVVRAARFSPDGTRVLTCGDDGTVRLFDAASGQLLSTRKTTSTYDASFDADGKRIAACGPDGVVRVWDQAGREVFAKKCHEAAVYRVSFAPDGRHLMTASMDGTAAVLDAADGRRVATLKGHAASVLTATYSADGRWVATGSMDGTAAVWDAATGKRLLTLRGHDEGVSAAVFHPRENRVVTAGVDGTVRLWDGRFGVELLALRERAASYADAAFSADGRRLLTLGNRGPRVLDAGPARPLLLAPPTPAKVTGVAFSADGKTLFAPDSAGRRNAWMLPEGKPTESGEPAGPVASPDGRFTAAGRLRVVEVRERGLPR